MQMFFTIKIGLDWMFAGVPLAGGVKRQWSCLYDDSFRIFMSLFLENFGGKDNIINGDRPKQSVADFYNRLQNE